MNAALVAKNVKLAMIAKPKRSLAWMVPRRFLKSPRNVAVPGKRQPIGPSTPCKRAIAGPPLTMNRHRQPARSPDPGRPGARIYPACPQPEPRGEPLQWRMKRRNAGSWGHSAAYGAIFAVRDCNCINALAVSVRPRPAGLNGAAGRGLIDARPYHALAPAPRSGTGLNVPSGCITVI